MNDLPRFVAATPVGGEVPVEIFRDGKKKRLQVKVGQLEEGSAGTSKPAAEDRLGLTVVDLTPEASRKYQLQSDHGALVSSVDQDGPAADSNLRAGDLVLEINGREIRSAEEFHKSLEGAGKGSVLRFLVQRGDSLFYTTLKIP